MAYVQSANATTGSSSTSFACAYAGNVVAGNLMVAVMRLAHGTGVVNSVTDTLGSTWTAVSAGGRNGTASPLGQLWTAVAPSSGANTVTGNWSVSATSTIAVGEYSTTTVVGENNAAGGNSDSPNSGDITTSVTKTLVGGIAGANAELYTEGSGWTQREPTGANTLRAGLFDRVGLAAGTYAMNAVIAAANWGCCVVALSAPAAGAASLVPPENLLRRFGHMIGR